MPLLASIPTGADVFIDANIFVYALNRLSPQCLDLLQRCSREELTGVSLFEIVNEATHILMLGEAYDKKIIQQNSAKALRRRRAEIGNLIDYWHDTEVILNLNIMLFSTDEQIVRGAQPQRQQALVLTNDSMILAWMREYGIQYLATADRDFDQVVGITVFSSDDI